MMRFLEVSIHLVGLGYAVFPLRPGLKVPITENGVKDATKDFGVIAAWDRRWPKANIGIACGKASNLIVIDVDVKGAASGNATLATMAANGLELPPGPIVETPSGGWHWYGAWRDGVRNSAGGPKRGIGPGIDVRSDGGYVVAPPSLLKKNATHGAGVYRWTVRHNGPLPPFPAWAFARLNAQKPKLHAPVISAHEPRLVEGLIKFVGGLQSGNRNNGLYWAACTLAESGHATGSAIDGLRAAAINTGMDQREALATLNSAINRIRTDAHAN